MSLERQSASQKNYSTTPAYSTVLVAVIVKLVLAVLEQTFACDRRRTTSIDAFGAKLLFQSAYDRVVGSIRVLRTLMCFDNALSRLLRAGGLIRDNAWQVKDRLYHDPCASDPEDCLGKKLFVASQCRDMIVVRAADSDRSVLHVKECALMERCPDRDAALHDVADDLFPTLPDASVRLWVDGQ